MKIFKFFKYTAFVFTLLFSSRVYAQACAMAASCEDMGFKMTEAQCSGKFSLKCPFDNTKIYCNKDMIGEIKIFAGKQSAIPQGWILADGRSLARTTYPKLYAIYGTTYGGTASNFNIPNLNRRFVIGQSSTYGLAATGGEERHTLTLNELPSHSHGFIGLDGTGHPDQPWDSIAVGDYRSYPRQSQYNYQGSSQSHENMPPYISLFYILYTGVS